MSERKLKGILSPNVDSVSVLSNSNRSIKKLFSPSPTIVTNPQKAPSMIDGRHYPVPMFYEIPGVQDFFYSPFTKHQEPNVQPSPWLEPFKIKSLKDLPPLSHASAQTAADTGADQTANIKQENHNLSQTVYSIVLKLDSQPKNLGDLLIRSFSSHSNSIYFPSQRSALPSPFLGGTSTFNAKGVGSIREAQRRGSSFRDSPFQSPKMIQMPKMESNTNEDLLTQIAELINRENDGKIKNAIAELLSQYGHVEPNQKESGNQIFADRNELLLKGQNITGNNDPNKPKTIALSNGLTMNALNRSPKLNSVTISDSYKSNNPQNTKIEAARKELFVMSENDPALVKSLPNTKQQERQDFNLFDFVGGAETTRSMTITSSSPLISTRSILKGDINMLGQSMNQQVMSLSANSSQTGRAIYGNQNNMNLFENQKGFTTGKSSGMDLFGKAGTTPNRVFRLSDDIFLPTRLLDHQTPFDFKDNNKNLSGNKLLKSPENKVPKGKGKQTKKSRAKGKRITMEEYVQHVNAREESNLTIDEIGEESEDWDDIEEDSSPR